MNPQTPPALTVTNLKKSYKSQIAVNQIEFEIPQGTIFGLLGPNGAGKTTTIRMLSGLLKPDSGTVSYLGAPLSPQTIVQMGLCPQELAIWDNLTVMEQLLYVASLYNVPSKTAKVQAQGLLESLQLTEQANKLAHALSGGMKRRLNIMLALMHDPKIIILDEPQAGLDPQSRLLVRDYIRSLGGQKTVLITTHDMEEAEKLLDLVAIIDHGTILEMDKPKALIAKYFSQPILQVSGDRISIVALDPLGCREAIYALLQEKNLDANDIAIRQATLEDLFIHLTGRRLRE